MPAAFIAASDTTFTGSASSSYALGPRTPPARSWATGTSDTPATPSKHSPVFSCMIILMPGLSIQGFEALKPCGSSPGAHRNVVAQPGSNVERLAHSICDSIPQGAGPPDGHHHLCSTMYSAWVACSEWTSVQLRSSDASAGPGPEGCAPAHARLEPVVGRGPRPGNTSQGATRKAVPLPHACLDPVVGQMMSSLRCTCGGLPHARHVGEAACT